MLPSNPSNLATITMPTPVVLFAPGAGAPSSHPWMRHWAKLLREIGQVETLDYPYMLEHRKRPNTLPQLIAAHREALTRAKRKFRGPVILIGKSMGSRIGCHLALEGKVHAVVCLDIHFAVQVTATNCATRSCSN